MTTVSCHLAAGLPPPIAGPAVSRPVDGFRLAYDRSGTGPGIVLLHGGHGDRTDWADVAVRLEGTVVTPDLRGVGESDRWPGGDVSVSAQAASVTSLIDELRLGPVVLGGHGIGAAVALRVAARSPGRVAGLVVTPPPEVPTRSVTGTGRNALQRVWTTWSAPGYTPSRLRLDHLAQQHDRRLLTMSSDPIGRHVVAAPTTILWPDLDPLVPDSWFDGLGEWFRRVTVRRVPGVGHFLPVEAPMAFVEALQRTVQERTQQRGF
ncbi:alpha/beta fold hydrolase [Pseudonocardia sp.]|jgi:pimeloyl-ACP methyl ester carboxylesterase|uniref:alpha/beta fold hydrolase n=1 Tax=Pseudonocardia sp. TaxID=60912 RepID=UPI003D0E7E96